MISALCSNKSVRNEVRVQCSDSDNSWRNSFFSSSTACIRLAFFYFLVVILMLPLDPHVIIRVGLLRHDLLLFMAHAVVYIMTVSCS